MTATGTSRRSFGQRGALPAPAHGPAPARPAEPARSLPSYQELLAQGGDDTQMPGGPAVPAQGGKVRTRFLPLIGAGLVMLPVDLIGFSVMWGIKGPADMLKVWPTLSGLLGSDSPATGIMAAGMLAFTIFEAGSSAMMVHLPLKRLGASTLLHYALGGAGLGVMTILFSAAWNDGIIDPQTAMLTMINSVLAPVSYRMFAGTR